ncbi:MAG: phosphodiester glycosidase family protein [Spirochaetes bacterium]|nr:phosphodiester glycosidase family protein [Spirochaetota bacterium]
MIQDYSTFEDTRVLKRCTNYLARTSLFSHIHGIYVSFLCCLCSVLLSCSTLWTSLAFGPDYEPLQPICQSFPTIEHIEPNWNPFLPGIELASASIQQPSLQLWGARIFLDHPSIQLQVGPVELQNGIGKSVKPSFFAQQYECNVAVNANPFDPSSALEGELRRIVGIAVQNGKVLSLPHPRYAGLVVTFDKKAVVTEQGYLKIKNSQVLLGSIPIQYGVGGFFRVLQDGQPKAGGPKYSERVPHTAAGVNKDGSILFLLVIDGYRRRSIGATEVETGEILKKLGATDGLLLDGGGSSVFVIRYPTSEANVLNVPMHNRFPRQERAVALCLGVRSIPIPNDCTE